MMQHYVMQQVTNGTSYQTIEEFSSYSIKDIVLYTMQKDFAKHMTNIVYDITIEKSNILDSTQFYSTGLTYKQLKTLNEEDIADICLMITTDNRNRDSLNYLRICPYLHKKPINPKEIVSKEKEYNKLFKPIKLKCIPQHIKNFCHVITTYYTNSSFYIDSELAQVYGLVQKPLQTRDDVSNHVKTVLQNAGMNLANIQYQNIPTPITNVMKVKSRYFKTDYNQSYHRTFTNFFAEYFRKVTQPPVGVNIKYMISPFLASYLGIDIHASYTYQDLEGRMKAKHDKKHFPQLVELIYTSKDDYKTRSVVYPHTALSYHIYNTEITETHIKNANLNPKHHPMNVYKSGIILQRFYRKYVKSKSTTHQSTTYQSTLCKTLPDPISE